MTTSTAFLRHLSRAALLAVAMVPAVRADDDVVKEDGPMPPPAQAPVFNGQVPGARVIIMPGLRLQVGGQGQLQVQGNMRVPAQVAPDGEVRREVFLGVVATEVSPPVRAQIDLPEGVGLSIDAVAAGGPAEKAGVRQFDVIHKFNDQVVCSPEQLTTLVKVAGSGTRVPLTLVRGGREKVVEAVLEDHEVGAAGEGEVVVGAVPGVLNLQQMIPQGLNANGLGPQVQADIERKVAEALARAGAGGRLPGFAPGAVPGALPPFAVPPVVAGNVRAQVLTIGPNAQSATVVSDARGTVEIRTAGGKKTVTVKDPTGKEVHVGPLDTDEDLVKVPDDYREWVREVDAGQPVVQPLDPDAEAPEKEPAPAEAEARGPTI